MTKAIEEVKTIVEGGVEVNGKYYHDAMPHVQELIYLLRKIEASNENESIESQPLMRKKEPDNHFAAYFNRWRHKRDVTIVLKKMYIFLVNACECTHTYTNPHKCKHNQALRE